MRFVDVVEGLEGELSSFLRKTSTPGEVFPLPIDIALNQPSFAHLTRDFRTVLRGVVRSLNDVYDCKPLHDQRISPLHVRILHLLSEEVSRFLDKLPPFENLSWKEFLKVRSIDYKGEEVKTAQQTSWDNIAPALPDEVATVDLEQVVESGCLHYVQHFEDYLLPRGAQVYTKPPKVMVPMDQWETFCAGLLSRGICGLIPESAVYKVDNKPLLDGLFGVLKEEKHQGREVHRLIMNLLPLNKLCRPITGDVSTLPSWPSMNAFQIQQDETLLISSEDVRCFFFLFRVPKSWTPYLAFSRRVPENLCEGHSEPCYLTSLVLPMGFRNSVSLAQHIHRVVVGKALEEARRQGLRGGWESELRKDRPLPISNPVHRVYLDNFDQLERVNSSMAEVLRGSVTPLAQSLRQVYGELSIPRHPKKAVERQTQADVQGALVDGHARPRAEKIMKYLQLSVLLLKGERCTQKQAQVVAGGLVYMAMFRRPLLGTLNAIWEFVTSFDHGPKLQVIPWKVRSEIARFCLLVPLARMDFRTNFSGVVTASDASSTGGGITASKGLSCLGCMASNQTVRGDVVEPSEVASVLTIGLFDGMGALRVAADSIGIPVAGHISIEKHGPACRGVESRFASTLFVDDVEKVDSDMVGEWACKYSQVGLVIIGAGPPCQGVSGLNADRRGALRDHRSCLFTHVERIHDIVRQKFPWAQVHRLMESVASMDAKDRAVMSESVGSTPFLIDPVNLCGCRRPRLFWPTWELRQEVGVTVSSPRGDGWEAITEVQMQHSYDINCFLEAGWSKCSDEPFPTFTTSRPRTRPGRKPAGVGQCTEKELKDWEEDLHRFPPYQYQTKFRVKDKHHNTRLLSCEEQEVLMGFPKGYSVACYPKAVQKTQAWQDERLTLVGNSWNVFVIAWLLGQLCGMLGLAPQFSLQQVMQQCSPGGGQGLQSFLLRPFMRTPHRATSQGDDVVLVRKLAGANGRSCAISSSPSKHPRKPLAMADHLRVALEWTARTHQQSGTPGSVYHSSMAHW